MPAATPLRLAASMGGCLSRLNFQAAPGSLEEIQKEVRCGLKCGCLQGLPLRPPCTSHDAAELAAAIGRTSRCNAEQAGLGTAVATDRRCPPATAAASTEPVHACTSCILLPHGRPLDSLLRPCRCPLPLPQARHNTLNDHKAQRPAGPPQRLTTEQRVMGTTSEDTWT